MLRFYRFAFFTTIATYFLIFIGGLVRVSGAGLGCPDWPTCFGRWFPPTSISQLPADVDPATFNITMAWIEYFNRLSGMLVGLLILTVALWAIFKHRDNKKILYPSMAAAILTAFQGWQGAVVVSSLLQPVIVTVHMLLALLIVSLLIYVTSEAHFQHYRKYYINTGLPDNLAKWPAVLWWMVLVQIILGTQIRGMLETISEQFPMLSSAEWLAKVGGMNHTHTTLGLLLVALTILAVSKILKHRQHLTSFLFQAAWAAVIVVILQIMLGLSFIFFDMTPIRQVFHMFLGSVYMGTTLYLFINFRRVRELS